MGMTEEEAIALGVVRDAVGGVWEHDLDHGDWQMRLPDGSLGDPESWTKVNGNYGPASPWFDEDRVRAELTQRIMRLDSTVHVGSSRAISSYVSHAEVPDVVDEVVAWLKERRLA